MPFGPIYLFVTFAPSMDDTLRTYLPKEVRIALRSHKALFYQWGLVLSVSSSIPLTPSALLQFALLTLLCPHQGDSVPTPTKRPRPIFDVIADIPPQGHAPWLARLLQQSPNDTVNGHRPLPWLTPYLVRGGGKIALINGNVRSVKHDSILSFYTGALIDGKPHPFVVAA